MHEIWTGMPEFNQKKQVPYHLLVIQHDYGTLRIRFATKDDLDEFNALYDFEISPDIKEITIGCPVEFGKRINQKITTKTKSTWHPFRPHRGALKHKWVNPKNTHPRYPVYVVSKGRWKNTVTSRILNKMGVEHYIIVEESEFSNYMETAVDLACVLTLPQEYLDAYNTCDEFGGEKSRGPGSARNFCLDHSKDDGFRRHWVMDDNLEAFYYLTDNQKLTVECADTLRAAEDFVDRYTNVPVAGLNYDSFCKATDGVPPLVLNTRIYSCLLIDNEMEYRWRGRYNEDTDLSLRVLKDGLCTIQFNVFLCGKITTQRMRGGNSKEFYDEEGTLPKSQMLADLHPDVAEVVWKFNRHHHQVNYKPFKDNKLIPKKPIVDNGPDNYGMVKVLR